jgi:hypothetical protein
MEIEMDERFLVVRHSSEQELQTPDRTESRGAALNPQELPLRDGL